MILTFKPVISHGMILMRTYLHMIGAKNSGTRVQTECFNPSTASHDITAPFVPLKDKNFIKIESRPQREKNNLARRRRRVNKLLQSVTSPARKERFYKELIEIEKKLQKLYKQSSQYKEKKAIDSIKHNPKYFYS